MGKALNYVKSTTSIASKSAKRSQKGTTMRGPIRVSKPAAKSPHGK